MLTNNDVEYFVGPRIIKTENNMYSILKLDNEKVCNNRCFKRCNNFNLNPGSMTDIYNINIKVSPHYINYNNGNDFSNKVFIITTPIPDLEYLYTTPDTFNTLDCATNTVTIGRPNSFLSNVNCNRPPFSS
jgi:hypothetical protein